MSRRPTRIVFPERLRDIRTRLGISQAGLARVTGLKPSAISHFERGRRSPSMGNLRRLCDAMSVSADWLLGRIS